MKELMQFEGNNVEIIQDENGNPLFEIYSTGMALGHVKKNAVGVCYPRKERIDENLKNAEITPCVHNGHKYINESQLYDFMLEARTDKCRKFRKWVTNDVLPSIRKTGSYCISTAPVPAQTALQPEYKYVDKLFQFQPVLTITDVCNLFNVNYSSVYSTVKTKLSLGKDYSLLNDKALDRFLEANPTVIKHNNSLYVIYKSGFDKLVRYLDLDTDNATQTTFFTHKGYVVQEAVRSVMEYVRREIKGIEALTYLIESNDTPRNLENYRNVLVKKLAAVNWWVVDVQTVKLGIHKMSVDEMKAIDIGEYGIR